MGVLVVVAWMAEGEERERGEERDEGRGGERVVEVTADGTGGEDFTEGEAGEDLVECVVGEELDGGERRRRR